MKIANQNFEKSLRSAVRKLSKGNFENSICEVTEHYQDIFNEAVASGKSDEESRRVASNRIGLVGDIAREVVDSPIRVKKGFQLQLLGASLWVLAPFLGFGFIVVLRDFAQPVSTAPPWLILTSTLFSAKTLCCLAGLIVGVGAFRATGIKFRSIAIGLTVNIAIASAYLAYATRPGKPIHVAQRVRQERIQQLSLEPKYVELEQALAICAGQGEQVNEQDLAHLQAAATKHALPGLWTPKHRQKYLYPMEHSVGENSGIYRLRLESTDSLEEVRTHWWAAADSLRQDLPEMASSRVYYFQGLRNSLGASLDPIVIGVMAIIQSLYPFAVGIGFAMLALRIRLYRLDSFKLHLSRK